MNSPRLYNCTRTSTNPDRPYMTLHTCKCGSWKDYPTTNRCTCSDVSFYLNNAIITVPAIVWIVHGHKEQVILTTWSNLGEAHRRLRLWLCRHKCRILYGIICDMVHALIRTFVWVVSCLFRNDNDYNCAVNTISPFNHFSILKREYLFQFMKNFMNRNEYSQIYPWR